MHLYLGSLPAVEQLNNQLNGLDGRIGMIYASVSAIRGKSKDLDSYLEA